MSRDSCQLCRGIRHGSRYQVKRPSEDTPGAVFIGFANTPGNRREAGWGTDREDERLFRPT